MHYLRPIRIPRGFSSLIVAVVFYPHWIKDEKFYARSLISISLSLAESWHANFALIVAGDFNCLDIISLKKHFRLKQIVKKPTRKNAIIDPVLTNLHQYYDELRSFPPCGLSDYNTVTAEAKVTESGQNPTKLMLKRDTRKSQSRVEETTECYELAFAVFLSSLTAAKICNRFSTKHSAQNSICSCPLRRCVWTHLTSRGWPSSWNRLYLKGRRPFTNMILNQLSLSSTKTQFI